MSNYFFSLRAIVLSSHFGHEQIPFWKGLGDLQHLYALHNILLGQKLSDFRKRSGEYRLAFL
jgi:hypothetical protein